MKSEMNNSIKPHYTPTILVVEDDPAVAEMLLKLIGQLGYHVRHLPTIGQGLEAARLKAHDIILLDVKLPDGSGLDFLKQIINMPGSPVVIIMTAYGDPDSAELAIRNGAWDYLTKPVSMEKLTLNLKRAVEYQAAKAAMRNKIELKRDEIVGCSRALLKTLDQVSRAGESEANVLIYGETGTGKELIARAIHENSVRGLRRFVVLDCAALPEKLVESLLFGHEKGAFTGAYQKSQGLIKQADGGTLFLDEIGELPIDLQKSFLRVLQERKYRPVGASEYIKSDFRLIAATNKNLDQLVEEKFFRDDLLFRICSLAIHVPPLRDRREDLSPMLVHFMKKFCGLTGLPAKNISAEFLKALSLYEWPGNVRELFSALEFSFSSAKDEPELLPIHLPVGIRAQVIRQQTPPRMEKVEPKDPTAAAIQTLLDNGDPLPSLQDFRYVMEKSYLEQLMVQTKGNRTEACQVSGLSRTRLFELLKKHKLQ